MSFAKLWAHTLTTGRRTPVQLAPQTGRSKKEVVTLVHCVQRAKKELDADRIRTDAPEGIRFR